MGVPQAVMRLTRRHAARLGAATLLAHPARAAGPPPLWSHGGEFIRFVPPPRLPALSLDRADGGQARLAPGAKWRLVNIMATWCLPCIAELPKLAQLPSGPFAAQLDVITLAVDDAPPQTVQSFARRVGLSGVIQCVDRTGRIAAMQDDPLFGRPPLPIYGLPTTYLITPDNLNLGYVTGAVDWTGQDATTWLAFYVR